MRKNVERNRCGYSLKHFQRRTTLDKGRVGGREMDENYFKTHDYHLCHEVKARNQIFGPSFSVDITEFRFHPAETSLHFPAYQLHLIQSENLLKLDGIQMEARSFQKKGGIPK